VRAPLPENAVEAVLVDERCVWADWIPTVVAGRLSLSFAGRKTRFAWVFCVPDELFTARFLLSVFPRFLHDFAHFHLAFAEALELDAIGWPRPVVFACEDHVPLQ
jgi:hypothetical protein